MATRFREGKVTVELTGDLERLALQVVDKALPGVRTEMEANARDILATAKGEWPVKSGQSRGGLQMITEIRDDAVLVKIENAVPYAIWVRPKAWFGVTTAWQRLVRQPMFAAAKGIGKLVGKVVLAALKDGSRGD